MADDRAEPLRDPEAERYLMGIINNEIPYVPGSEYEQEEDVVSSFLNLDGGTEIVDDQEGEGTDIVDGGQPSTNDDLELQVATTSGEVYIYTLRASRDTNLLKCEYICINARDSLSFFSPPDRVRQSVANPRR